MTAVALEPGAAVEFGVVFLDLAIAVDQHVVDTGDRVRISVGQESPSPRDGVASVPDVKSINRDLGLKYTLAVIESLLAGESNGTKL